jgi:hypothetical protein
MLAPSAPVPVLVLVLASDPALAARAQAVVMDRYRIRQVLERRIRWDNRA